MAQVVQGGSNRNHVITYGHSRKNNLEKRRYYNDENQQQRPSYDRQGKSYQQQYDNYGKSMNGFSNQSIPFSPHHQAPRHDYRTTRQALSPLSSSNTNTYYHKNYHSPQTDWVSQQNDIKRSKEQGPKHEYSHFAAYNNVPVRSVPIYEPSNHKYINTVGYFQNQEQIPIFNEVLVKQYNNYNHQDRLNEVTDPNNNEELVSYFAAGSLKQKQVNKLTQKVQEIGEYTVRIKNDSEHVRQKNVEMLKQECGDTNLMKAMSSGFQRKLKPYQVDLEHIDNLIEEFKKISISGLRFLTESPISECMTKLLNQNQQVNSYGRQFTLMPTLNMVLKYRKIIKAKDRDSEDFCQSLFIESNRIHLRKPLFVQLQEVMNEHKIQFSEKKDLKLYQTYKIVVEWHSFNKSTDVKILSVYDLDEFGCLKFNSFFNPQMFCTMLHDRQFHRQSGEHSNPHSQDTTFEDECSSPRCPDSSLMTVFMDFWSQLQTGSHNPIIRQYGWQDLDHKMQVLNDIYSIAKYQELQQSFISKKDKKQRF